MSSIYKQKTYIYDIYYVFYISRCICRIYMSFVYQDVLSTSLDIYMKTCTRLDIYIWHTLCEETHKYGQWQIYCVEGTKNVTIYT